MPSTTKERRNLTPGHAERHAAHMKGIGRWRSRHTYSDAEPEGEIELKDSASATSDTAERLEAIENKIEEQSEEVRKLAGRFDVAVSGMLEAVESLKHTRIVLDEQSILQWSSRIEQELSKMHARTQKDQAQAIADGVGPVLKATLDKGVEKIQQAIPADTPAKKLAVGFSILGGVVSIGVAALWIYASANFVPPTVSLESGSPEVNGGNPL